MVAIATQSIVLGINDLKIAKLTADSGASPTYATSIDVPAVQGFSLTPNFTEKELRGDEAVIDSYTKLDSINFQFTSGKMSLDALAVLLGGTLTAGGTTPAQTQTYSLKSTDVPNFFKIETQSKYAEVGDAHVVLYKCKASKVDYELKGEDYAVVTVSGKAIPATSNSKVKDIVFNETAVAPV